MKIRSIKKIGKRKVYDISVSDNNQYVTTNGVIHHNTGGMLSSDTVFIIGRQQEKEGTEIVGYNFVINIEKSRHIKEKSKLMLNVRYENGIDKFSGIKELAIEAGFIVQSGSWFQIIDLETGEINDKKIRGGEITDEYLEAVLLNEKFKQFVERKYKINKGNGKEDV